MEIIGHQKQWDYLKKIAQSGRIPHALIFAGEAHLGKKTVALEYVKFLFGKDFNFKSQHPDLILIEPQEETIQISQIREVIWKLSLKPALAPLKVAIVEKAHLMNQEAQNCFLKTLEEPKGNTLLILITEYPEILLPTITSRCQIVKFYPAKKKEIENYLKSQNIEEEKIKEIFRVSRGKPGLSVDFILNPQKLEERIKIEKELLKILKSDLSFRFQYAKETSKDVNLKEILGVWLSYFRDNLISNLNLGKPDSLKKLTLQRSSGLMLSRVEALINILQQIQRTIFLLSTTNINQRLALEILMLEI